jgi:hypothetical protein
MKSANTVESITVTAATAPVSTMEIPSTHTPAHRPRYPMTTAPESIARAASLLERLSTSGDLAAKYAA